MRILGVDPGSRLTGYGCIDWVNQKIQLVTHGTLKLANTSGKATVPLEERLLSIHRGLSEVIAATKPDILVVEKVFFAKNAVSALKLGQARGAVILTGMIHGLAIAEYNPTEVKRAVVGQGHADKDQVARMIELMIGKQEFDTPDASDGLALAICHAHSHRGIASHTAALKAVGKKKKKLSLAEALGLSNKV
jgi:crossover junction endodeoxyribonuclease RuvC